MKANWKSFLAVCVLLVSLVVTLNAIDVRNVDASGENQTALKIVVVDQDGKGVHNAKISLSSNAEFFYTDNKGVSPSIEIVNTQNWYDSNITDWFCVNVTVEKSGYVNTVVVGCVIFVGQTRNLSVKIYSDDGSGLPIVCYVESPPQSYLNGLFQDR